MSNVIAVDFGNKKPKESLRFQTIPDDTWVMLGSKGSGSDLDMAMAVYQRALAYAAMSGVEDVFQKQLLGLHCFDRELTAYWDDEKSAEAAKPFMNLACEDHGKEVKHVYYEGE
jgi:hypothetical protein